MKEFISLLISFLFMGIADNIDSAFNNALSIDAIVVCGTLFSIDLILKSLSEIGIYTYRTARKDEAKYLIIQALISFIIGIIVFIFGDLLINIFDLTEIQKAMLSDVLKLYILYLVCGRVSNALFEMTRLKNQLKLYRKSLILFYVSLISLDAIFYITTKNLNLLFTATMISWILSIIYMLYNLKIKFELPDKETLQNVLKYGIPTSMERLLSRIFILIYGAIASHLGTDKYSIHTICYSVCISLEIITNSYQAALMIKVPVKGTYKEQYEAIMEMKKKCFGIIVLLNYVFCIVYLLISHGSLPLKECFPYIIFYSFRVFGLYPYETYKTLCIAQGKPKILLWGSTIGVMIRIIVCLLFYNSSIALLAFGLANFIDFYSRSIMYRIGLYDVQKDLNEKYDTNKLFENMELKKVGNTNDSDLKEYNELK